MMKLLKIFRLEFGYQVWQVSTWMYFAVVFGLAFLTITANYSYDAREGYFLLNAPIVIASVAVVCCLFWLLLGAAIAGDAAARDVHTRMFSLTYTAPAGKIGYLGGRFLAAFALNIIILLAIPAGILAALYFSGMEAAILGPFRLASYLNPLLYILLPNAFFVTAIQFAMAALLRKAMASYLVSAFLFISAFLVGQILQGEMGQRDLAILADPVGFTSVMSHLNQWSLIERNTRLIEPGGTFLVNRMLWLCIALGMLAFTYFRFRFTSPSTGNPARQRSLKPVNVAAPGWLKWEKTTSLPQVQKTFGLPAYLSQLRLITLQSFRVLAKKPTGLLFLGFFALLVSFALPGNLDAKGAPLLPRTDQVLQVLTAPVTEPGKFWMIIYLLTIFYAGELVWRERESGLSELSNAAPVPEWVLFLSRFLSLGLLMIVCLVFLLVAGILAQTAIGGATVEPALYLKVFFGFQLAECLLFAMLVLVVHVVVNQKYLGHLAALLVFGCLIYAPVLGLEHNLLIFGSSPRWSYTSMAGFGESVEPWLWFKFYWAAWALLLAVLARLFWVRGREISIRARLRLAGRRFTQATAITTVIAAGLIVASGSFIFYNTNMINRYTTASDLLAERAAYERQYGKYNHAPQPQLTGVSVHIDIFPERRELEIRGTYLLVNKQAFAIDTIHLAIPPGIEARSLAFSRPVIPVMTDRKSGFMIYALRTSLEPNDSLKLDFNLHHQAKGFSNNGANAMITANFSHIRNYEWLPLIGYQPYRELDEAGLRKKYGLAPRPATASLYDIKARNYAPLSEQVSFNAVVSTNERQTVVAPGALRKSWKKGNRRYFHYVTDAPIRNDYSFLSARYALYEAQWKPAQHPAKPVDIQIYYDPGYTENLERIVQAAKASLDYYTDRFGPYPHQQLRFVAKPGYEGGNHADPVNIIAEEGFFLLNPKQDPRGFDLVTAVVAHEVAHQWWGKQLRPAHVEGAGLLSESLAWYSAMGMLEDQYGPEHLEKLLSFLREEYENPRSRAALPLLRATGFYHYYRKGPFALYALSQYIGMNRVNEALRNLLRKHPPGKIPMPTSLSLYRELQAVTPDSFRYLLHDLFKENIFWELKAKQATVKQVRTGLWQVTFNIQARKQAVSQTGLEKEIPLSDWIEVGIFAEQANKPLYLKKHFVDTNRQTITLTVPFKPSRAGIDPNHLLIDWDMKDNFVDVQQ